MYRYVSTDRFTESLPNFKVMGLLIVTLLLLFAPLLRTGSALADPTITEYSVPPTPGGSGVVGGDGIATGPDGALWFTEEDESQIGRITTSGSITEYSTPTSNAEPANVVAGPDGALWFTEEGKSNIGRITTSGAITEYPIPGPLHFSANGITVGPDGNLWFAEGGDGDAIGKITPSGNVTEYSVPDGLSANGLISKGPDGNLWFGIQGNYIGQITPSGNVTIFTLSDANAAVGDVITGPDGNIWYVDYSTSSIGRMTTSGSQIGEYPLPSGDFPSIITSGPDGNVWFTSFAGNVVGSINMSGNISTYPVPTAHAGAEGITTGPDGNMWFTENTDGAFANTDYGIGKVALASTPSAPTNLTAPSPAQNPHLSWDSVSGATSYNIYRNGSLIDMISADNTSYTDLLAPEGANSYYVTAVNSSGESDPSNSIDVLVDQTAPSIGYTVTPVADNNGYNTGQVKVTFNCTDNPGGSGIASCADPVTVDNEGIGQTVDGTATDNAGNSTAVHANASLLNQSVNAGGSASGSYGDDGGFYGGNTYTSSADVDSSNVLNPAPQDVYQSTRYGNSFSYTFNGLTANADYTLKLHFNEPYWGVGNNGGGVGSRVFNVAVNGQAALTNYDVYQVAGGANKAVTEQLPVTADANGNVTVQFSAVKDNAIVSGLQLFNGDLPAQAPHQANSFSTLINAGGDAIGDFAADSQFSGGTTYTSTDDVNTNGVTNPAPESVFRSTRYGTSFSYTIPDLTPNTSYNVRLDFNEPYFGVGNNGGGVGSRVFNVAINGDQKLSSFDIFAEAGGANVALAKDFTVTADSNGQITIQFTSDTNNAIVSGIEVTQS